MFSSGEVVHHLVRRGVQATADFQDASRHHPTPRELELPLWAKIVLPLTIAIFAIFLTSLRYTLWGLVTTLTAIEEPQTTYIVHEEKSEAGPDAFAEDTIDAEVLMIKQKPITSKIRATVKHLQSRAGFLARWRGLSAFITYMFCHGLLVTFLRPFVCGVLAWVVGGTFGMLGGRVAASTIASVLLARLGMTWTHVVISEPSNKSWIRRIPDFQSWKNVVPATTIADLSSSLPIVLAGATAYALSIDDIIEPNQTKEEICAFAWKLMAVFAMAASAFIGITIPATVSLIRVQASMLPDDDQTIVPFDRSFRGKVVPRILGGTGAITFKEAWMTFDRPARLRMLKLVAKLVLIEVFLHMFIGVILSAEFVAAVGPENIRRMIHSAKSNM